MRLLEEAEEGGRVVRGERLARSEGERQARGEERPDGRVEQGVLYTVVADRSFISWRCGTTDVDWRTDDEALGSGIYR